MEYDYSKLCPPLQSYRPTWTTSEQRAGTETLAEHLCSEIHAQQLSAVEVLTVDEQYILHDQLHDAAGDTAMMQLYEALGAKISS